MTSARDLECINNIMKATADDYANKRKTRGDQNKSEESPNCTTEYVQVIVSAVVKQILERLDGDKAEIMNSKDEIIKNLEGKVSKLEDENKKLRQVDDDAQQYNRRDNLKIIGVRYQKDEDVIKIVQDIAKHTTGDDLNENEISVAHRIMSNDDRKKLDAIPFNANATVTKQNSPSIIVKFCRRSTKTKVFEHRKQTAFKPNSPHPKAEIYEDVTPLRSRILYALRNKKDNEGNKVYRYVWSREGRLYCRTEQQSKQEPQPPPHKINCPEDLAGLGFSPSEILDIIENKKQ